MRSLHNSGLTLTLARGWHFIVVDIRLDSMHLHFAAVTECKRWISTELHKWRPKIMVMFVKKTCTESHNKRHVFMWWSGLDLDSHITITVCCQTIPGIGFISDQFEAVSLLHLTKHHLRSDCLSVQCCQQHGYYRVHQYHFLWNWPHIH